MNSVKGETPLNLSDGRQFILVLDFDALIEAEAVYGKPLLQMMEDANAGFVGAIRAMLYGSLRRKHPKIALSDASAMLMTDGNAVQDAVEKAAVAAMPETEGKEPGNAPNRKARRATKTSGGSGAKRA